MLAFYINKKNKKEEQQWQLSHKNEGNKKPHQLLTVDLKRTVNNSFKKKSPARINERGTKQNSTL